MRCAGSLGCSRSGVMWPCGHEGMRAHVFCYFATQLVPDGLVGMFLNSLIAVQAG